MNAVIKIPSPKISQILHLIKETGSDEDIVIDQYMAIVANTLSYVGGTTLGYSEERIVGSQSYIEASVDVRSLPEYKRIADVYGDIDFERELLKKIRQAHQFYGLECPIANGDRLRRSPDTWSPRWITVYIWVLISASMSKDKFAEDSVVIKSLFDELVKAVTE